MGCKGTYRSKLYMKTIPIYYRDCSWSRVWSKKLITNNIMKERTLEISETLWDSVLNAIKEGDDKPLCLSGK